MSIPIHKTITTSRLLELVLHAQAQAEVAKKERAEKLAALAQAQVKVKVKVEPEPEPEPEPEVNYSTTHRGKLITYNSKQQEFINLVNSLQSCILLGAAGTGKTTAIKGALELLLQNPAIRILGSGANSSHKFLLPETPGIICCSYTRRAVSNIKKAVPKGLESNCLTLHKVLEYAPVKTIILDEDGNEKQSMRFEPQRHRLITLPQEINIIIIDEASMVSVELFQLLVEASHDREIVFIFTGDIQQLPPVFGSAILGYKMLELPTIELTEVYRQALDSPIIKLAHRILEGSPLEEKDFKLYEEPKKLLFYTWKKAFKPEIALVTACKLLTLTEEEKAKVKTVPQEILDAFSSYNPEEDIILCPFNKAFGTLEINKRIAQNRTLKEGKIVYEILSGYEKHYFSVGEKILFDKEDAEILEIIPNSQYTGRTPQKATKTLDYWGIEQKQLGLGLGLGLKLQEDTKAVDIDFYLESINPSEEDRITQASHRIKLKLLDTEEIIDISSAAEINTLLMSYALTVHKAQGSEYRRVFLLLHSSHAVMVQRELLYTAVTRAKEELYIICESETFVKGILNQRIKGNTLKEKAEFFKGKIAS